MKEIHGNIWNSGCTFTAVTTNGIIKRDGTLVMGAGIAKAAAARFPKLPAILADHVRVNGNVPSLVKEFGVVSFPTKNDWKNPSDMDLIINSAEQIAALLPPDCTCAMSRPGCGNGGLQWTDVKPHIEDILDDRFYVYYG